ncbi:hypothetical protein AX13_15160 [Comamonas aquatica DA1877]|uniref:Uncharacterized protein n=1 Tax=Comamonas aquatica DA1877 TaxID=1457173 RepID=A0A014QBR4_9BURK|nr:hypothetical protein AX13_15160 [Comamonas aquatica DA1877]
MEWLIARTAFHDAIRDTADCHAVAKVKGEWVFLVSAGGKRLGRIIYVVNLLSRIACGDQHICQFTHQVDFLRSVVLCFVKQQGLILDSNPAIINQPLQTLRPFGSGDVMLEFFIIDAHAFSTQDIVEQLRLCNDLLARKIVLISPELNELL